ncbi:ABC transporter ATP-binding protein [Ligilactobacillus aviarius]|uniref:ABC transporter ATP-binding protein n=1 Tax=Ligilactobacillus aviarius TaxID=1606 RepID=UPI00249ED3D9|nr:ABC transporter ATP-binding protein [Ligilactobacillus aviarius]
MLKAENLNVYYGNKKVISNASFDISPGEIVGLIGPNGAGKSTIMKTLLGLTKFTGKVLLNNKNILTQHQEISNKVGALIEGPAAYPFLSGKENLELYSNDESDMDNLIRLLKMEPYIDQRVKNYSIGMKEKLGIALALLNNPEFVILDEPMNGLDIESTILVRKIIKEYSSRGTAFLISSHVLSELQKVMTSIIIVNHGKIIMDLPIEDFHQIQNSHYQINTENNQKTLNLFKANNITVESDENHIIISNSDLRKAQQVIFSNGLTLTELMPADSNFEQAIVSVLQKSKG